MHPDSCRPVVGLGPGGRFIQLSRDEVTSDVCSGLSGRAVCRVEKRRDWFKNGSSLSADAKKFDCTITHTPHKKIRWVGMT